MSIMSDVEMIEPPWGNCPVQASGRVRGFPFYFRARWDMATISIHYDTAGDPVMIDEDDDRGWYSVVGTYEAPYAGWISHDESLRLIETGLQRWADTHPAYDARISAGDPT